MKTEFGKVFLQPNALKGKQLWSYYMPYRSDTLSMIDLQFTAAVTSLRYYRETYKIKR